MAVLITGTLGAGDVWIFDVKSGVRTRVTTDGRSNANLAWSPDGLRVLFSSQRDGPANLFVQAADGGSPAERIVPNANAQWAGSWLRDGTTISYVQIDPNTGADVWALRLTDRRPWPLIVLPAAQFGGRVSPDGRWLAYTSNQSGTTEVWVTTFRQPGPGWQVSAGGGQEVVWSPDSRELYFRHDSHMLAVPLDPAANPPNGRAVTLFEGPFLYEPNFPGVPNYDVGPDGRFLMISSEAGPADQVQIVLNWTKYLAARLGTPRSRPQ
jgi:Tol biopolymer transport system component